MKKSSPVAVFILIFMVLAQVPPAAPVFATQGQVKPFSDVPAGGWPYRALSSLAGAGLLDGYRSDSFGPGRVMTRYEVAYFVARARTRAIQDKKAIPSGLRETLNKLEAEFKDEMAMIQFRDNILEANPASDGSTGVLDRLQVTGAQSPKLSLKEREAGGGGVDPANRSLSFEMARVAQVDSEFKLNDHLEIGGRLASILGKEDQLDRGRLGFTLNGRIQLAPRLSISSEYTIDGIGQEETRVGKDVAAAVSLIPDLLNVQARYHLEDVDNLTPQGTSGKSTTTVAVDGEMALNKQTTLRAGYEVASTQGAGSEILGKRTTAKVGVGYQLGENASLQANYQLIDFEDGENGGGESGVNGAGKDAGAGGGQSKNRLENAASAELSIKF
ncbi:MAG: S-layer homology domain-containing protein [Firmicutes bacterium]|nr:S-layer homology domain-containing protein [Bacillota bacterium]